MAKFLLLLQGICYYPCGVISPSEIPGWWLQYLFTPSEFNICGGGCFLPPSECAVLWRVLALLLVITVASSSLSSTTWQCSVWIFVVGYDVCIQLFFMLCMLHVSPRSQDWLTLFQFKTPPFGNVVLWYLLLFHCPMFANWRRLYLVALNLKSEYRNATINKYCCLFAD